MGRLYKEIQDQVKQQPKKNEPSQTSSITQPKIKVGSTVTGAPGTNAIVTVTGEDTLNFTIPAGNDGRAGQRGYDGSRVMMRRVGEKIQWRYETDTMWADLFDAAPLVAGLEQKFANLASVDGSDMVGYTAPYPGTVTRTLEQRLGETVSVADYGALGDGVADDSAAFNAAMSSGAKLVLIPPAKVYYRIKEVTVPVGVGVRGLGRQRVYNPYQTSQMINTGATMVFITGGAFCMHFSGLNNVEDLNFWGVNRSVPGLGLDVGQGLNFRNVTMAGFSKGFGGTNYVRNSRFWNCHAAQNNNGFQDLVDSHVYGAEINANKANGVYMGNGANDTVFVGTKNEWNDAVNWVFYNSGSCMVIGGVTDRSGDHGFHIISSNLIILGTKVRRSGRLGSGVHFNLGGNNSVIIAGVNTTAGADDDGGGISTPERAFRMDGSTAGTVVATGSDLSGYLTAFSTNFLSGNVRFVNCVGTLDTKEYIVQPASFTSPAASNVQTINVVGAGNLGQYTSTIRRYVLQVSMRNASSGAVSANRFMVQVTRGGAGNATPSIVSIEQPSNTLVNTTGAEVNVSVSNGNIDATTFDISISSAVARQIAYSLWAD